MSLGKMLILAVLLKLAQPKPLAPAAGSPAPNLTLDACLGSLGGKLVPSSPPLPILVNLSNLAFCQKTYARYKHVNYKRLKLSRYFPHDT